MYNSEDYIMDILDRCGNLDVEELEMLISNIEIMIENKNEESEENDK